MPNFIEEMKEFNGNANILQSDTLYPVTVYGLMFSSKNYKEPINDAKPMCIINTYGESDESLSQKTEFELLTEYEVISICTAGGFIESATRCSFGKTNSMLNVTESDFISYGISELKVDLLISGDFWNIVCISDCDEIIKEARAMYQNRAMWERITKKLCKALESR